MKDKLKAYYLIGLFCFFHCIVSGQNQQMADSLYELYLSRSYQGDKLVLLKEVAQNETNPDKSIEYAEILLQQAKLDSLPNFIHSAYLLKGNALRIKGDNIKALDFYFKSLEVARLSKDEQSVGGILIAIADTYSVMDNSETAEKYYTDGIHILREVNDSVKLATALLNLGDEYFNTNQFTKALDHFEESGRIFNKLDYPSGTAYNYGNVGMVYAELGEDKLAKENIDAAMEILEKLEDFYPMSVYLNYMSDIYARQNEIQIAFNYANRSLKLAEIYGLKEQISEANLQLSELYKLTNDFENAYDHYTRHIAFRDSINNISAVQEMARLRTDYEISQKQAEVDLLAQQRKTQKVIVIAIAVALLLIILIAIGLYRRNKFISKTKTIIENERNRSDRLLLNILPEETAQELKDMGKVKSKRFESVSVLFSDFKDFTKYSENLSPEELVESVDHYFSRFDEIIQKYDLEKIKTIGDCYMCAGGLPFPSEDHATKVLLAAFEILEFVEQVKNENTINVKFDVRIGINTGPVVAGVVGSKKFAYDIWGDTVNIASRMESGSEAGKINISENTYRIIKEDFICEYRGEIEVKNKGMMKMYYVTGLKPETLNKYSIRGTSEENRV